MRDRFPFIALAGALVSRLSAYAVLLLAARLLMPREFGAVAVLMIVAAILNALASGGGDMWLNRFTDPATALARRAPWVRPVYLAICAVIAIVVIVLGAGAALALDLFASFSNALILAVLGAAFAGLAEALLAVVRASGRILAFFALRDIIVPVGFIAAIAIVRPMTAAGLFAVYATLWGGVFLVAGAWSAAIAGAPRPYRLQRRRLWTLAARHTITLIASNLSSRLAAYIDVLALSWLIALAEVGEYRVAALLAIGFMVVQHFVFLGLPWEMRRVGDDAARADAYERVRARQRILVGLGGIALVLAWLLAEPLLLLFGDRFTAVAWILRALAVLRFAELLWGPQHEILISNGFVRADAEANIAAIGAWGIAFALTTDALDPRAAAVVAVGIASLVGQIYRFRALRRAGLPCPRGIGVRLRPSRSHGNRVPILIVVNALGRGGTESHLARVLPRLVARGWSIVVYTLLEAGVFAPRMTEAGVRVLAPSGSRPWARLGFVGRAARLTLRAFGLCALAFRLRPGIVHYFLPAGYLIGGACLRITPAPIEIMSRRSLNAYQRRHPLLARIEHRMHPRMTAILGNSEAVLRELENEPGVPRDRLVLIRNGIDTARFAEDDRATARRRLDLAAGAFVMAIVANLIPYKGHADLIDALAHVRDRLPAGWRLLCVGRDDGIRASLEARVAARGLVENIRWLGERDDVAEVLAAADLGILCSHEEGFSNAVLESMAAGLAMVVTDVGGNREAVIDGVTGLVVPPRAPEALGEAIATLAADPARRAAMGAAGRTRVAECFSLDRCVADYDRLYRALIAGERIGADSLRKNTPQRG